MVGKQRLKIQGLPDDVKIASDAAINEQFAALEQLADAMSDDFQDETTGWEAPPQSEVRLPTVASLGQSMNAAAVNTPKGGRDVLSELCQQAGSAIDQDLRKALTHKEENITGSAAMRHNNTVIIVPNTTRDIPNALYYGKDPRNGRPFYQRGRADLIFNALFGPMAPRVMTAVHRAGFERKPLVWVSQILYHQVSTDVEANAAIFIADHKEMVKDIPEGFNAAVDDGQDSMFMKGLYAFCESTTVRNLSRAARYEGQSIIAVLRSLVWKYCDVLKIKDNG